MVPSGTPLSTGASSKVAQPAPTLCFLSVNPFITKTVLLVGYWIPITYTLLTLSYVFKTPVSVLILSVNLVYQLTGYKLSPMKWSNTGNV